MSDGGAVDANDNPIGLRILLDDPPCVVVNKPGGVLTQAPPGIDSLEQRVRRWVQWRVGTTGNVYVGVPHRLDRGVSGALIFTRHIRAAQRISKQFQQRSVRKTYWALVEGIVQPETGTWRDWMRKIPERPMSEIVPSSHPEAAEAVLHYRVLRHEDFGTWLEIELETGRMHQIRLQCAVHGYPILGDDKYGSQVNFGPITPDERARWIGLHARSLAYEDPMLREPRRIEASVWSWWLDLRPAEYWTL